MGWFIFGLILYFIVLLAERVLVGVSPHEVEQLRADTSKSAQRACDIARQIRPNMAALVLARLLLKLLLVVFPAAWLVQSNGVRTSLWDTSQWLAVPAEIVWFAAALSYAAVLALMFWLIKKIDTQRLTDGRSAFILQRLSLFILFWKRLFSPFLKKEKSDDAGESQEVPATSVTSNTAQTTSEKREIELLKSIVKFSDVTVKQVMQPRSKVVAVDFCLDFYTLLDRVRDAGFSRLPVYQDDLDNVTGILYVKDLVPYLDKPEDFEWQSLIRTNVLLAPESKRGAELLQEFKQQKVHMAIVVDEYGGSAGIVTLEDILEEVTGEIRDEFDEESEVRYRKLDDFNYLFEGQTLLSDVCRIAGLNPNTFDAVRGNADTLAGLALELKGDIPKTGAEIVWNSFLFTVLLANSRRIEQLKLTLPR